MTSPHNEDRLRRLAVEDCDTGAATALLTEYKRRNDRLAMCHLMGDVAERHGPTNAPWEPVARMCVRHIIADHYVDPAFLIEDPCAVPHRRITYRWGKAFRYSHVFRHLADVVGEGEITLKPFAKFCLECTGVVVPLLWNSRLCRMWLVECFETEASAIVQGYDGMWPSGNPGTIYTHVHIPSGVWVLKNIRPECAGELDALMEATKVRASREGLSDGLSDEIETAWEIYHKTAPLFDIRERSQRGELAGLTYNALANIWQQRHDCLRDTLERLLDPIRMNIRLQVYNPDTVQQAVHAVQQKYAELMLPYLLGEKT